MEIQIKPEDLDKYIQEAVLKSTLGKNLTVTIEKAFQESLNGWDAPIRSMIKEQIKHAISDFINLPENKMHIENIVKENVTISVIDKIVRTGTDKFIGSLNF